MAERRARLTAEELSVSVVIPTYNRERYVVQAVESVLRQEPYQLKEGHAFGDLLRGNFLSTPTIVALRQTVADLGGFNESPDLIAREDYELWLRLAMHGSFSLVNDVVALVRVHPGNLNRMPDAENVRRTIALYKAVLRPAGRANRQRILVRLAEVQLSLWAEGGRSRLYGWRPLLFGAWYRLRAYFSALAAGPPLGRPRA